jgi:2-phospho-L-lactate guanylyltransferase
VATDAAEVDRTSAAVVALKPATHAKSRLGTLPDPLRRRLAWTMAVDTLAALAAVTEVLVVSEQPALASRLARAGVQARVVDEGGAEGLNGALAHGAQLLRAAGHDQVLACVGDLPALRPATVTAVLAAASAPGRYYLADASGTGTTMLVAVAAALDPHFQGASAAAHQASGATPLTQEQLGGDVPDARSDVDTEADLAPAAALGTGPATAVLLRPGTGQLAEYSVITTTSYTDVQQRPVAVTATGHRVVLPPTSLADGLRALRPGQRLHCVHVDGLVRSAWL